MHVELHTELSRELSLFHITMMGLGMMIGAGVFLGIGNSLYLAGPGGAILTFSLNGVIALFTAMSYAELSSAIPRAGGAYNFARIGFGRGISFIAGWMEWFASSVAGSVYALTLAIYTLRYFEGLGFLGWLPVSNDWAVKIVALAAASFFVYINYRGASETGKVGAFFTMGQTLFLVLIGVVGIVVALREPLRFQNFTPFVPMGWMRILVTMGFTYVAFEGFEVIAQAGDETVEPKKNLPKAMLFSVYIATVIYVCVAFATIVSIRPDSPEVTGQVWQWIGSFRERGFGEAISRLIPMGNILLTLAVIFASTSALNATIYSATRASYALGRDHMLPSVFANISKRRRTPATALLFTGVIVILIAFFLPTVHVASSASIMFLFLFFMVNLCVIKIRYNMGDELSYGFIMPFFPVLPIVAILMQSVLAVWLVNMSVVAWIIAPSWIGLGVLIYLFYARGHAKPSEHDIFVLEEEKAPEGDEFSIMVAVSNPDSAIGLVRTTYQLCGAKSARVELLHMVPVPVQVPLADAQHYMMEGKEAVIEVMLYLAPLFPVSTTLRYCRSVARGIVSAIREKRINLLIMGYPTERREFSTARRRHQGFILGSTIDPVVERTPCDVVIFKDAPHTTYRRILVPVAGGPNSVFALEVASILMDRDEGEIVLFTVDTGGKRIDIDQFMASFGDNLDIGRDRLRRKIALSDDVVHAIREEATEYDLVVIGITNRPFMYRATHQTVPEELAHTIDKPLVMVKAQTGVGSMLKRFV
jgi:amino acid transporter/nucleotide-binding universal stress UspA family protein